MAVEIGAKPSDLVRRPNLFMRGEKCEIGARRSDRVNPGELAVLVAESKKRLSGIRTVLIMSHLACADEPDHPANVAQHATFEAMRARLPMAPASLANSAGIFLGSAYHFDLARPGAALYGINPTLGRPNPMRFARRRKCRCCCHSRSSTRYR